jgi:hypothetical protein
LEEVRERERPGGHVSTEYGTRKANTVKHLKFSEERGIGI